MYNILIAPNSFKGSLSSSEVAEAIEEGLLASNIGVHCRKFPLGDGGDDTASLLTDCLGGQYHQFTVSGPYGNPVDAKFGLVLDRQKAILEIAETSGLKKIQNDLKSPMFASTKGLGQLINHVIDLGVTEIIVCLGGSATIDAGVGMLNALGVRFMDDNGNVLEANPDGLDDLCAIDIGSLNKTLDRCQFTVLCDVDNRLLGEEGAVRIFGPQKGATKTDIIKLEEFLINFDNVTKQSTGNHLSDVFFGASAGGVAAAFEIFLNAKLLLGAEYFCSIAGFAEALSEADLLITGEGSIDTQSLHGKAPIIAAKYARSYNVPTIGLAGKIPKEIPDQLEQYFFALFSIGNEPDNLLLAMKATRTNLTRTAKQVGNMLALSKIT